MSRLPPVQNRDFCLIGRKTKESLTGSLNHIQISYTIACLTSGAIFKTRSGYDGHRGNARREFSAALPTSLDDFIRKSLKDEQTECIRRIISLEEAVFPILPTGFGDSVITDGPSYVFAIEYLLTCKTKFRNLKHKANGRKRFRKRTL